MNEAGQDAVGPAEVAGDGGKGGAEQTRQLEGGIVRSLVDAVGSQGDADHHRDDIAQVLAEGGEAHNGKDPA